MRRTLMAAATIALLAACTRSAREVPAGDASPPIPKPAPTTTSSSPIGTVTISGTVDRAMAERMGLAYARRRWPEYQPNDATAFIQTDGSFHVVVGFGKRPDAASVFIRSTDGHVMDASIAPSP